MGLGFIVGVLYTFLYSERDYKREQDKYFEKVDYSFFGKMHSYQLLSGSLYFIEIDVDSATFTKNNISNNDDFVGLYSKKDKQIFFLSYFETGGRAKGKIVSDTLPYVRVNSSTRTVEYITDKDSIFQELLRTFLTIDLQSLKDSQTEEMVRF